MLIEFFLDQQQHSRSFVSYYCDDDNIDEFVILKHNNFAKQNIENIQTQKERINSSIAATSTTTSAISTSMSTSTGVVNYIEKSHSGEREFEKEASLLNLETNEAGINRAGSGSNISGGSVLRRSFGNLKFKVKSNNNNNNNSSNSKTSITTSVTTTTTTTNNTSNNYSPFDLITTQKTTELSPNRGVGAALTVLPFKETSALFLQIGTL